MALSLCGARRGMPEAEEMCVVAGVPLVRTTRVERVSGNGRWLEGMGVVEVVEAADEATVEVGGR